MKEEFLHYVWQYKLFSFKMLLGTKNEEIYIIKSGVANVNSGPDFLNAQIIIDGQKWAGNVEIHLKSSDWYGHNHEEDVNYDAVILHVVYEDDVTVFMKNNKPLPTLVLKDKIPENLKDNYKNLLVSSKNWIPCEKDIANVDVFLMNNWLERLYIERLEEKTIFIKEILKKTDNNYEAVLFQLLAKSFGLKVNGAAFLTLAQSVDFSIVRKESFDTHKLSALLFGQSGFLEGDGEDYYKSLKNEYEYLQHKYGLKPVAMNQFQFFRMRPSNFPTIRIAQLTALYCKHQNLFSKLIKINKLSTIYELLSVEVADFWKEHYTFETSSKKSSKRLTKPFINLLIINAVIPLRFIYGYEKGVENKEVLLDLLKQLPAEKNNIISKFMEFKIIAKNGFESQSLLHLKNSYCSNNKCLQCVVGNNLLNKNKL